MGERNSNGQFAKGNKGGPGRPKKKREERYTEILLNTCTFEKWAQIIQKAVEQALEGDHQARKWLADYLVGTPVKQIDLTSKGESVVIDSAQLVNEAITILNAYKGSAGS